ncbi:MAG: LPP20 family lipoprotein [Helicobacteraceae bacterium]|nr:LPP20 family lipoprotein [Helicobacteraceae bacterium]
MRIFRNLILGLGILLFIAGCSSKNNLGEGASSIEDSALEVNNLMNAPSWVLNGGGSGFSAIGSAEITKAGLQFARNEAIAMARDELARMISVKIEGVVNNAISQSIGNNAYDSSFSNVEKFGEQITRQVVSQTLTGSKQKDTWITGDGKQIYVLIELDSNLAESARQNIMKNMSSKDMPVEKDKFLNALDKALGNEF